MECIIQNRKEWHLLPNLDKIYVDRQVNNEQTNSTCEDPSCTSEDLGSDAICHRNAQHSCLSLLSYTYKTDCTENSKACDLLSMIGVQHVFGLLVSLVEPEKCARQLVKRYITDHIVDNFLTIPRHHIATNESIGLPSFSLCLPPNKFRNSAGKYFQLNDKNQGNNPDDGGWHYNYNTMSSNYSDLIQHSKNLKFTYSAESIPPNSNQAGISANLMTVNKDHYSKESSTMCYEIQLTPRQRSRSSGRHCDDIDIERTMWQDGKSTANPEETVYSVSTYMQKTQRYSNKQHTHPPMVVESTVQVSSASNDHIEISSNIAIESTEYYPDEYVTQPANIYPQQIRQQPVLQPQKRYQQPITQQYQQFPNDERIQKLEQFHKNTKLHPQTSQRQAETKYDGNMVVRRQVSTSKHELRLIYNSPDAAEPWNAIDVVVTHDKVTNVVDVATNVSGGRPERSKDGSASATGGIYTNRIETPISVASQSQEYYDEDKAQPFLVPPKQKINYQREPFTVSTNIYADSPDSRQPMGLGAQILPVPGNSIDTGVQTQPQEIAESNYARNIYHENRLGLGKPVRTAQNIEITQDIVLHDYHQSYDNRQPVAFSSPQIITNVYANQVADIPTNQQYIQQQRESSQTDISMETIYSVDYNKYDQSVQHQPAYQDNRLQYQQMGQQPQYVHQPYTQTQSKGNVNTYQQTPQYNNQPQHQVANEQYKNTFQRQPIHQYMSAKQQQISMYPDDDNVKSIYKKPSKQLNYAQVESFDNRKYTDANFVQEATENITDVVVQTRRESKNHVQPRSSRDTAKGHNNYQNPAERQFRQPHHVARPSQANQYPTHEHQLHPSIQSHKQSLLPDTRYGRGQENIHTPIYHDIDDKTIINLSTDVTGTGITYHQGQSWPTVPESQLTSGKVKEIYSTPQTPTLEPYQIKNTQQRDLDRNIYKPPVPTTPQIRTAVQVNTGDEILVAENQISPRRSSAKRTYEKPISRSEDSPVTKELHHVANRQIEGNKNVIYSTETYYPSNQKLEISVDYVPQKALTQRRVTDDFEESITITWNETINDNLDRLTENVSVKYDRASKQSPYSRGKMLTPEQITGNINTGMRVDDIYNRPINAATLSQQKDIYQLPSIASYPDSTYQQLMNIPNNEMDLDKLLKDNKGGELITLTWTGLVLTKRIPYPPLSSNNNTRTSLTSDDKSASLSPQKFNRKSSTKNKPEYDDDVSNQSSINSSRFYSRATFKGTKKSKRNKSSKKSAKESFTPTLEDSVSVSWSTGFDRNSKKSKSKKESERKSSKKQKKSSGRHRGSNYNSSYTTDDVTSNYIKSDLHTSHMDSVVQSNYYCRHHNSDGINETRLQLDNCKVCSLLSSFQQLLLQEINKLKQKKYSKGKTLQHCNNLTKDIIELVLGKSLTVRSSKFYNEENLLTTTNNNRCCFSCPILPVNHF